MRGREERKKEFDKFRRRVARAYGGGGIEIREGGEDQVKRGGREGCRRRKWLEEGEPGGGNREGGERGSSIEGGGREELGDGL